MSAPMSAPASDRFLKPVITLLYVNLGISLLLAALTFVFKNAVLDFQMLHMSGIDTSTPAAAAASRRTLESVLWIRPVSVLIVSLVYVRLAGRLKLGKRTTYIRVLVIAIAGFLGLAYLVASAQFPVWMRVGQVVQAFVLLGLLFAVTRKDVRAHFAKRPKQPVAA